MDERLKRRLVGAFVLVSLAVIFLPMLLEEPQVPEVRIERSNIPPEPSPATGEDSPSGSMPLPDDEPLIPPPRSRPVRLLPSEQPQPVPAPGPVPAPVPESPPGPPAPTAGIASWVVQVASLSNRDNADKLAARLRAKGYSAFLEQISVKGRTLVRVRVGPEADLARARRTAERIAREFELKGQVVRYP